MHKRHGFLAQIKNALRGTDFGDRVYLQRQPPRRAYPAICVYSQEESIEIDSVADSPRIQRRELVVTVALYTQATQDDEKLETDIDLQTARIESVVTMPTGAIDLQLFAVGFPEVFVDDEKISVAETRLAYRLTYETVENNPTE